MIVIKRDTPQVFAGKTFLVTPEENQAMSIIADSVSLNRGPLVRLLQQHDIQVAQNASHQQLLQALKTGLAKKQFALDFEKQFKKGYSNYGDDVEGSSDISNNSNDPFWAGSGDNVNNPGGNTNYGYGGGNSSNNNSGGNTGGGGGWLGAISGILNGVGTIGQLFSKPDATSAQLNYNQQILALAQQKEATRKRNQTFAIVGVSVLVVGVAIFLIYYAKKNKAI